jgi:prefoldin subunit 5
MNSYEQRQQARRDRLLSIAAKLEREGNSRYERARQLASCIPMGQPMLVDHHSYRSDRSFRERLRNMTGKAFAQMDAAKDLARRAEAVGSGGISSDDPDAVSKLRAQLAQVEALQAKMRAVNQVIRKNAKKGAEAQVAALVEMGYSEAAAREALAPDYAGRIGFPSYRLSNNNANANRIKQRIAQLEQRAAAVAANPDPVEREVAGVKVVEDPEANRLRLIFPGKPAEAMRAQLKSYGFRWAPSEGAWQRQLSSGARYAAEQVLAGLPK